MPEASVSAGFARGLVGLAVGRGANREALLELAGIAPQDLQDQDNRIPFRKYVALFRSAQALCRDPALALHYGEAINFTEVSVVGLVCSACESMEEALVQFNRYVRLVVDVELECSDRFLVKSEPSGVWLTDTRKDASDFWELTETVFAQLATATKHMGKSLLLKEVHFAHAEPAYRSEYDRVFGVPLVFRGSRNAARLDEAFLKFRVSSLPRYAFGVLSAHADRLLERLNNSKSTRGRVEELILSLLHTGKVSMDGVAGRLGLSRQTLFRRLKSEGVTFEAVLDALRRELALNYISGKKASIGEIAYLTGFANQAAFSRAFKRWTGKSPRAARTSTQPGEGCEPAPLSRFTRPC